MGLFIWMVCPNYCAWLCVICRWSVVTWGGCDASLWSQATNGLSRELETELSRCVQMHTWRTVLTLCHQTPPCWVFPWFHALCYFHDVGRLLSEFKQYQCSFAVFILWHCLVQQIWDLASGTLKLSLTGHVSTVRGLAVSARQPYLFSCGEDKMVRCWDLEQNKVHVPLCIDVLIIQFAIFIWWFWSAFIHKKYFWV